MLGWWRGGCCPKRGCILSPLLPQEASGGLQPLVFIRGTCAQRAIALGVRAELTSPTTHLRSSSGDG